ncbi:MAG TPA: hypothetical protein VGK48_06325 [Terriglobia bacterium]|jgi:hypothetical protein
MNRASFLAAGLAALFTVSTSNAFSQIPAQNRIPQQVVINGITVNAASVTTSTGQIQSYTCSSPQQYMTAGGRSQGWACYDETTGVWLLNAVPPVQAVPAPAAVQQQPVQQPAPVYQQPPYPQTAYPQPPVYQQAPVYQGAPLPNVVYQQPPAVVYQPAPTVIYQQPAIVYAQPVRPVVVAPAYPPSVILGAAAIGAVGRIASAAIISSRYPRAYYYAPVRGRRW